MVCKHLYAWFLFISQYYGLGVILLSLYLIILCSLYLLWFTINTYLWRCNILVLNTPLFRAQLCKKISLILLLADIVLAWLIIASFGASIIRAFVAVLKVISVDCDLGLWFIASSYMRLISHYLSSSRVSSILLTCGLHILTSSCSTSQYLTRYLEILQYISCSIYLAPRLSTHKGPSIF